jgi:hypothetical protein
MQTLDSWLQTASRCLRLTIEHDNIGSAVNLTAQRWKSCSQGKRRFSTWIDAIDGRLEQLLRANSMSRHRLPTRHQPPAHAHKLDLVMPGCSARNRPISRRVRTAFTNAMTRSEASRVVRVFTMLPYRPFLTCSAGSMMSALACGRLLVVSLLSTHLESPPHKNRNT